MIVPTTPVIYAAESMFETAMEDLYSYCKSFPLILLVSAQVSWRRTTAKNFTYSSGRTQEEETDIHSM